jgi:carboxypeptidase Taq
LAKVKKTVRKTLGARKKQNGQRKQNTQKMLLLKKRLKESAYISSTLALLHWDQEVLMPSKGINLRSQTIAHMSGLAHSHFLEINKDGLLTDLKKVHEARRTSTRRRTNQNQTVAQAVARDQTQDQTIVLETWKSYERAIKLPENFIKELAETQSKSNSVWAEARARNDFSAFCPWLEKIIILKRKEAELVGFTKSPYDALIDVYEPGMTAETLSIIFAELKMFLVEFLEKIKKSEKSANDRKKPISFHNFHGNFPADKQMAFSKMVAAKIGFDLDAGRIDLSAHPFTTNFHSQDVRFTTHIDEHNIMPALSATIHEAGHALYEQGLPQEHFGTPLAESISLGIHESQSRFWENCIGKSQEFWQYFYPALIKEFPKPFGEISIDTFYRSINQVKPSLIRIEADEVTYNLHIIIRFEIEKALIEGSIEAKDLPAIWRSKMKEYLGIDVPSDSLGVLQDTHWAQGLIGYFPTYTLGNLYSAQFFAKMMIDIPDLKKQISRGEFRAIFTWLRNHIHTHGKIHTADSIVQAVTGEPLTSQYFIEYLREKFSKIYSFTN